MNGLKVKAVSEHKVCGLCKDTLNLDATYEGESVMHVFLNNSVCRDLFVHRGCLDKTDEVERGVMGYQSHKPYKPKGDDNPAGNETVNGVKMNQNGQDRLRRMYMGRIAIYLFGGILAAVLGVYSHFSSPPSIKGVGPEETKKETEEHVEGFESHYEEGYDNLEAIINAGIGPDVANEYNQRFRVGGYGINFLRSYGISPGVANAYHERFSAFSICSLFTDGISPGVANAYHERFDDVDITRLRRDGVGPDVANVYPERFGTGDIIALGGNGIGPDVATTYHERFDGDDIAALFLGGIGYDVANAYQTTAIKYGAEVNGQDIVEMLSVDISPEEFEKTLREKFILEKSK